MKKTAFVLMRNDRPVIVHLGSRKAAEARLECLRVAHMAKVGLDKNIPEVEESYNFIFQWEIVETPIARPINGLL